MSTDVQEKISKRIRSLQRWRTIWGILLILAVGYLFLGFNITTGAVQEVSDNVAQTTDAGSGERAGAIIGTGIGAGISYIFVFCTGIPFALFFLIMFLRAGGALRSERQHSETLSTMSGD